MSTRRVVAFVLLLGACSMDTTVDSTVAPAPPSSSTTIPATTTTTPQVEAKACGSAQSRPWSVLCRAHDLILDRSLYGPDSPSLAAAATTGVNRLQAAADATPDERIVCHLPDPSFASVCAAITDRHRLDGIAVEELVSAAVHGMFRFGLDPYSSYLDAEQAARLQSIGPGHLLSLGMVVGARDTSDEPCGPLSETCVLRVLTVFGVGPAVDADIQSGDVVLAVDGHPVDGVQETEAAAHMSAAAGQVTTLTLRRGDVTRDVSLIHAEIPTASVEYGPIGSDILYLRVNDLTQQAAQAVGQVLSAPDAEDIDGIVLDLRGNPGGLVLSAQAVASQFLDSGLVLVEETRRDRVEVPVIDGGLVPSGVEVVVIVDSGTASAAEIVAAALQAAGRATVIGTATFGKNVVQEVFSAPGGGEYRITVARWLGPGGTDVGIGGLAPDILVDVVGDTPIFEAAAILGG